MKFEVVKEKLDDYIEHGNHEKVMAMYVLLSEEISAESVVYDEATIDMLEERRGYDQW